MPTYSIGFQSADGTEPIGTLCAPNSTPLVPELAVNHSSTLNRAGLAVR